MEEINNGFAEGTALNLLVAKMNEVVEAVNDFETRLVALEEA